VPAGINKTAKNTPMPATALRTIFFLDKNAGLFPSMFIF
jgi:hypothetical protein